VSGRQLRAGRSLQTTQQRSRTTVASTWAPVKRVSGTIAFFDKRSERGGLSIYDKAFAAALHRHTDGYLKPGRRTKVSQNLSSSRKRNTSFPSNASPPLVCAEATPLLGVDNFDLESRRSL
jgi:hypothetical protein